jgi:hypothetical protein
MKPSEDDPQERERFRLTSRGVYAVLLLQTCFRQQNWRRILENYRVELGVSEECYKPVLNSTSNIFYLFYVKSVHDLLVRSRELNLDENFDALQEEADSGGFLARLLFEKEPHRWMEYVTQLHKDLKLDHNDVCAMTNLINFPGFRKAVQTEIQTRMRENAKFLDKLFNQL